ncbi:MAG: methyltransferase domain-containing protein [Leeuwenhoekiella sp.]
MDKEYKKAIVDYYDHTKLDYRLLWFSKGPRSVHFGYYEKGIKSHGEALLNLNRVMAKKAKVSSGDKILDAGCGQGGSSVWLAKNYDVEVNGVTIVPHQVAVAKRESAKRGLGEKVSFSVQDYCSTHFEDESFSVIWACESMCHAQDKLDFYKEAYRLLKPGGRLISADYIRRKRPLSPQGENLLHDWLDGWSIKDLDTHAEHKQHAKTCGFSHFEINDITANTRPSLQHLHSMSRKLWNLGKLLKKIGLRNEINHGNQYASIKQYEALEQDLWYYGLIHLKKD